MLSVIVLNVIMLSVIVLNVIMLRVIMLNVIMQSVIMPYVIMLSVVMLKEVVAVLSEELECSVSGKPSQPSVRFGDRVRAYQSGALFTSWPYQQT
jgi:hypothetical protein